MGQAHVQTSVTSITLKSILSHLTGEENGAQMDEVNDLRKPNCDVVGAGFHPHSVCRIPTVSWVKSGNHLPLCPLRNPSVEALTPQRDDI